MTKRIVWLVLGLCWVFSPQQAMAECTVYTTAPVYIAGKLVQNVCNVSGGQWTSMVTPAGDTAMDETNDAVRTTLVTQISGEDQTATSGGSATGVMVTEQRYLLSATVTADTQIKATAGFMKDITCIGTDAAATAGSIILYNNTTETSPAIFTWNVAAAAVLTPITFPIDFVASTGIYLGFTTTADVACYVRYR